MNDPRYIRLKAALEKLTNLELKRVLEYPHEMVYDTFNFDEAGGRY